MKVIKRCSALISSLFHTSHKSQSMDGKQLSWTVMLLGGSHFLALDTGESSPLPSCGQLMTMQILQGSVKAPLRLLQGCFLAETQFKQGFQSILKVSYSSPKGHVMNTCLENMFGIMW